MTAAATLLALALFAGDSNAARARASHAPAPSCIAPARTGTFRMMTTRVDGTYIRPALLVLENIDGCLEATFVTDGSGPAIIDRLKVQGDELTGSLRLPSGDAKVTITFGESTIAGSITEGRLQWKVEGRRTS
jgi:hypothetical protein